jgi:hypothetical protein
MARAKHRHFRLAAKPLGVSQPALIRSLKKIESDLWNVILPAGVRSQLRGPIALEHRRQERGRQAEKHHAIERFQRAHQLPVFSKIHIGVAVTGHRAQ